MLTIDINMQGKVAIVTGAASGLGKATAEKLAQSGANVCIVDINEEGLEQTAELIREAGVGCLVRRADIGQRDQCFAVVAETVEHFGQLDALCNVAGIIVLCNSHEMSQVDWEKTLAVNLSGPFYLAQAAIPHLLATNGAIVNVTSQAASMGQAYTAAYGATKAGLTNLTKSLAMEYMHKPIRINAVAPGGMATNIAHNFNPPKDVDFGLLKRYSGMRGMLDVGDAADLIAMLCSDAGRSYHGSCLSIDNGVTAG
jgi:NAD(P)-dependent dehydrogenase (short-subunit alcohol dehydrogenase family)